MGFVRCEEDIPYSYLTNALVFNQEEHHIKQYLKFAEILGLKNYTNKMEY